MAGASAVQIGTVNFSNPHAGKELVDGLIKYFEKEGINAVEEIKGII
jgi:dihydroorotate dehydrogenase (NAD+) catalytic subunit